MVFILCEIEMKLGRDGEVTQLDVAGSSDGDSEFCSTNVAGLVQKRLRCALPNMKISKFY